MRLPILLAGLAVLALPCAVQAGSGEAASSPAESPASCADAVTTLEINECQAELLARADARMAEYLAAARERAAGEPAVLAAIATAQQAFETYREAECAAVYEQWKDGTIRTVMALGCRRAMAEERTRLVWHNWLEPMDGSPPALPEPAAPGQP